DGNDDWKIAQRVDRNNARNTVDVTRRPVGAAPILNPSVEGRLFCQFAAYHCPDAGIAGKHCSVAPEHGDRPAVAQTDCSEEVLKITNIDSTENNANKFATGTVDPACQKERRIAGALAVYRRTDQYIWVVVGRQLVEIIAVEEIDGLDGPI